MAYAISEHKFYLVFPKSVGITEIHLKAVFGFDGKQEFANKIYLQET